MAAVQITVPPIEQLRARGNEKWSKYGPDVLPMWVAEMDFPTAEPIAVALQEAVAHQCFGYLPDDERTALPEAVATWYADTFGWRDIDPADVHILPDVLRGVELAIDYYTPPASPVIVTTPSYMPFFDVPGVVSRPRVEVPMRERNGRWELDLDGIDAAFAAGAGSIIVCQPYNPLGRVFTVAELQALAEIVDRHGARVVVDEIHAPLAFVPHVPYATVSAQAATHSITVTSASKAWNMPGLKCAFAITTSQQDRATWQAIPHLRRHGASSLGVIANVAALTDGSPWLDAVRARVHDNFALLRTLLADRLPQVSMTEPEATYLAWLDCAALDLPTEPGVFFLDEAKVALNPGRIFGADSASCVRMNLATSPEIIATAVDRMATAVAQHR